MRGFQTYRKYYVVEIQFGFICFTLHVHDGCQMWSYTYINKQKKVVINLMCLNQCNIDKKDNNAFSPRIVLR